jgi:hypothetical protein
MRDSFRIECGLGIMMPSAEAVESNNKDLAGTPASDCDNGMTLQHVIGARNIGPAEKAELGVEKLAPDTW